MVKGKTEPERMYALLGDDAAWRRRPPIAALVERQAEFLALYRSGGFAEALAMIDDVRAPRPRRSAGGRAITR